MTDHRDDLPVQRITVILGDQKIEPLRPDVEIDYDAATGIVRVNGEQMYSTGPRAFEAQIGAHVLRGWHKLICKSTVVDDADHATPLDQDAAYYWGVEP